MTAAIDPVQLEFELPLDPLQLSKLLAHERRRVYDQLDLDTFQREVAELEVRRVIAKRGVA